jgi:ABC-type nitrate/sulfonate/bicarbonate transport system substrate-binding protein
MTIAVIMANSDWVKANPDLVRRYMTAWLRGARMYCQAYHGASNRQEIIDELGQHQDCAESRASGKSTRGRRAARTARSTSPA